MSNRIFWQGAKLFCITLAAALAFTSASIASGQESTGQTKQAIVSGQPVHPLMQEELGLLTLDTPTGVCSASLLTNEWIITAAHCLNPSDLSNPNQVTLTASWKTEQTRQASEIRSLRILPTIGAALPDIAVIRVEPFVVFGSSKHFRRELVANKMDNLVGYPIETYGRGRNVLAQGSGATAMPSQSDDQYRSAETQISKVEGNTYWFPRNSANQIVMGGDSGGPSFIITRTGRALVGVHSKCRSRCLRGQTCDPGDWTWISDIPECADAPIAMVYYPISQIIKESVASLAKDPVGTFGERKPGSARTEGTTGIGLSDGRFDTSVPGTVSYIYAVRPDGDLVWRRHDGAEVGLPQWQNALPVGNGWQDFTNIFSGGRNIIYAITQDGDLLWYRHNSAHNVAIGRRRPTLEGPKVVGKGWGNFRKVFSAGDGVIYAIDVQGNLLWYKHKAFMQAVEMPSDATLRPGLTLDRAQGPWVSSWEDVNPRIVGRGWGDFKHVFSGGNGIIYAVTTDGTLLRYRHVAFMDGRGIESAGAWEGPRTIKSGWGEYQRIFSSGDGVIYAVAPSGELFWFKDRAPLSATAAPRSLGKPWMGPRKVDDGWGGFVKVFALMPSAPDVIR